MSRTVDLRLLRFILMGWLAAISWILMNVEADAAESGSKAQPGPCVENLHRLARDGGHASLSSDEEVVVNWLVRQILRDVEHAELRFTAEQVSETLGIDVSGLNQEKIREKVQSTLLLISCFHSQGNSHPAPFLRPPTSSFSP